MTLILQHTMISVEQKNDKYHQGHIIVLILACRETVAIDDCTYTDENRCFILAVHSVQMQIPSARSLKFM